MTNVRDSQMHGRPDELLIDSVDATRPLEWEEVNAELALLAQEALRERVHHTNLQTIAEIEAGDHR